MILVVALSFVGVLTLVAMFGAYAFMKGNQFSLSQLASPYKHLENHQLSTATLQRAS